MLGFTYSSSLFADDQLILSPLIFSSIEAFILEMQMEYSKLNLWLSNSEVADSWLMEYEPHADKPEKLGTTIRVVRLQLHENQVCVLNQDDCIFSWKCLSRRGFYRPKIDIRKFCCFFDLMIDNANPNKRTFVLFQRFFAENDVIKLTAKLIFIY